MTYRLATLAFFLVLIRVLLQAQLPSPQKLSPEDDRTFKKELQRLRALLSTANDKGAIQLQIANTYAAGGQYREAVRQLRKVVDADLGFDPTRDLDFRNLLNAVELQSMIKEVRRQTPPVLNSLLITTFNERNLFPESLAFDATQKVFVLGNTAKDEIVRCSVVTGCMPLVAPQGGEGYVLGLNIDKLSGAIWATNNTSSAASLRRYDIETGKLQQTASIEGKHVFNDLALSPTGVVYVTDTSEGSVYQLDIRSNTLRRMLPEHTFTAANGIATSPDGNIVYVSAWRDGIDVIDLRSGSVKPISHPDNVCLAFIDGLYAMDGSLIAIQNGPMVPRIVRFRLNKSGREIVEMTTLERRNPLFEGITTGALVGNELYYVANPQTEKKNSTRLYPLQILSVRVVPE